MLISVTISFYLYVSHSAYGSCSVQLLYIYAEENCSSDFCSSRPKYYVSWTLLVIMNCYFMVIINIPVQ